MRDDAGLRRVGLEHEGEDEEPRGVGGAWDGPRSRREVREGDGRGASRRECDAENARSRRNPNSNIVLGIGRSTSLSEPTRFGAIGHEIHAAGRDYFSFLLFCDRKAGSRSCARLRGVANCFIRMIRRGMRLCAGR